jgi:hypothetical protein
MLFLREYFMAFSMTYIYKQIFLLLYLFKAFDFFSSQLRKTQN